MKINGFYTTKTFGLFCINNGRPKILNLWCAQIKRLREDLDMFVPAVVVSGEEDKATCQRYHVHHITQPNHPASFKFNVALGYFKTLGLDYCTVLGSDDIISSEFLREQIRLQEEGDYDLIGIKTFCFYAGDGPFRGQMVRLTATRTLGIAKTFSKRVLDQCDWKPWNYPRNWGMDAIASKTIAPFVKKIGYVEKGLVVDVKTLKDQLNSYRIWGNRLPKEDPEKFHKMLSETELQILKSL